MNGSKTGQRMTNFFDTNILLYALDTGTKSLRANELIAGGGVVSVQVLNEFLDVARRKLKLDPISAATFLNQLVNDLEIVDLTRPIQDRAVEIMLTTNTGIYDANIVAAAELAGCDVLYTEDLNDGQRIGRVTIRNPFM
jgi:predicted nucleic acid-binding protein